MENNLELSRFQVEVKHHFPVAHQYTWEIHADNKVIRVQESPGVFNSWGEANEAGKRALSDFLKAQPDVSRP